MILRTSASRLQRATSALPATLLLGALLLYLHLLLPQGLGANDIQIANGIVLPNDASSHFIQFDLSWHNSWYTTNLNGDGVTNWDAAWVFDLRLTGDRRIAAQQQVELLIQGLNQPAELRLDAPADQPDAQYALVIWTENQLPRSLQVGSGQAVSLAPVTQKVELRQMELAESQLPVEFSLAQNYPNPFNPTTTIGFALPEAAQVRLEVYNIQGQCVATLVNECMDTGRHQAILYAASLPSGVYIYRI